MEEIYSFGYWVKRRRKALDMTQASLAYEVGCATSTIRKIESDERRPSRTMAERLADGLRIPDEEREDFILSGLGEVSVHRMAVASEPVLKGQQAQGNLPSTFLSSGQERLNTNKNNLPTQPTPFIGREDELAEIRAKLMQDDCRLLSLLGPGGSGKTRLAIEAAKGVMTEYQHGIFFVNLAPVQAVEMISSTIAASLGFSFYDEGSPDEQLIDYLRNKQMLLILDNFEHLLEGACLVNEIMNAVPEVKILVTSRASLAITGEHLYPVGGMDYPGMSDSALSDPQEYSAIRLFESGARRRQPAFMVTGDNLPDVARICTLVEGMPLGIVLAASWVMMLTPAEIADEISRDLEFLKTEMKDLPQRQRSMQSIFNHSWRLLNQAERRILSALSVFRGGFTGDAAREVAEASLSDLMGLIDKSMLQRVDQGRFEVHELLRQFAAEQLRGDPNRETDIHSKHSETYLLALAGWERELQSPQQIEATQEIRIEIDNIRAAWQWAVDRNMAKTLLGAINGFCIYLYQNHQRIEGEEICQHLVQQLNGEQDSGVSGANQIEVIHLKLKARALAWGSFFNWKLGDWDRSNSLLQECHSTLERSELMGMDTRFEKAMVYMTQTMITSDVELPEINKMIHDTVGLFTAIDETWWAGRALTITGERTASTTEGLSIYEQSLKIAREVGDLQGSADSLYQLSVQYALKWQLDKAMALAYEALEIYQALGDPYKMAKTYAGLGGGMVWQGRFEEARSIECKTLEMYADLGYQQSFFAYAYVAAAYPDLYLGEYQAAREQAQYAMDIYKKVKHDYASHWTALTHDILGRAALAEGTFAEAENWFLEVDTVFRGSHNPGEVANFGQNLANLGFTKRGLSKMHQARDYLNQALQVATNIESYLAIFHILPGIALLFADQGEVERAVELYALAATQGIVANSIWFADIAGDEIARAAEGLPVEVVEAAKARGRSLDLWGTAKELLVELEQAGWGTEAHEDEANGPSTN